MNYVKVAVSDLLAQLKVNKDKHVKEFNEAMIGYREALKKELHDKFLLASSNVDVKHNIDTVRPTSYETFYDEAIAMMEWTIEKEVELDRNEFKQYVQDEWSWKNSFAITASLYK